MSNITAVDPTQVTPTGVQTMTGAQTGAPVAVSPAPSDNLSVSLPMSGASTQLMDRLTNNEGYRTLGNTTRNIAGGSYSAPDPANTVTITADGGKKVTTTIDPNKTYIFKDKKTGKIEVMGVGEAGARAAAARGQAISSANKKNKSNWRVYAVDDPNSDPKTWGKAVLYDKHHSNVIGAIANIALPAIGFLAAGPLGAALGSAASGAAQGKSIGNILKSAALSGITSSIGGQLFGGLASPVSSTAGSVSGNLATSAANGALGSLSGDVAGDLAGDIIVNGVRQAASSGLSSALGGAVSAGLGSLSSLGNASAHSPAANASPGYTPPPENILVNAHVPAGAINSPFNALGLGATAAGAPAAAGAADDIIVTGHAPSATVNAPEIATGALGMVGATAGIDQMVQQAEQALKQKGFHPTTGQILTALQVLGGLGGAGGAGGGGAGSQALNPIFSAQLPAAGANFGNRTPRAANTDWDTYATRPEQSFFSNVPVRQYAQGGPIGDDLAVPAMSDGRSDDKPIMASNGEYVVDAETVALLGNGSPEAGARKLDEFRVNLRKQKGAALAEGKFTPPARMPEAYMGAV